MSSEVVGLRPFVPAKDFSQSLAFYEAVGFSVLHRDDAVAILTLGQFGFVLQNFYVEAFAANCMVQLLVRDVDSWWASADPADLAGRFAAKAPIAPAMQPWGLKIGFLFDPAGVLWHVTESPA